MNTQNKLAEYTEELWEHMQPSTRAGQNMNIQTKLAEYTEEVWEHMQRPHKHQQQKPQRMAQQQARGLRDWPTCLQRLQRRLQQKPQQRLQQRLQLRMVQQQACGQRRWQLTRFERQQHQSL